MNETIIEEVLLNYLADELNIDVFMEMPDNETLKSINEFIVLDKTGGMVVNHISIATFAIQSYAESLHDAAYLNEAVKTAMDSLISLPVVTRSEYETDYNYTDARTKMYRYQCVYDITYYRDKIYRN